MLNTRLLVGVALLIVALPATPAQAQETVEYYGVDVLGSVRVVFAANGTILNRHDYEPFGKPVTPLTSDPKIFAGLFRDEESQLEAAQARMYQSRTGRLTTVDPVFDGLFDPQRWNRYTYALNNPLRFVDPSGRNANACDPNTCTTVVGHAPDIPLDMWFFFWGFYGGGGGGGGWTDDGGGGGGGGRGGGTTTTTDAPANDPPTDPPVPPTPPTPPAPPPAPPNPAPKPPSVVSEFLNGCKQGAAIVADTAIPLIDPFKDHGVYDDNTPGMQESQFLANVSFGILDIAMGVRGLADLTVAARRGSVLYRVGNNPYVRVGHSMWPRTQGRIPRLAIGTNPGALHWDLRICGR